MTSKMALADAFGKENTAIKSSSDQPLLIWITAIALTLTSLHLVLVNQAQSPGLWAVSCMFWSATGVWFYQHRLQTFIHHDRTNFWGLLGLLWLLFRSLHVFEGDYFLRLYPLLALLGLTILVSGVRGLYKYRSAIVLLSFLAIPWDWLYLLNITEMTTGFATTLLKTFGFSVQQQGFLIALPSGAIEVYNGCSGVRAIAQLLGFAWIYAIFTGIRGVRCWILLLGAVGLGFTVNGFRVALLAILSSQPSEMALHYWHQGDGSLIFSGISVLLLGLLLWKIDPKVPIESISIRD